MGYLELLVQQTRLTVPADQADALKQSWVDLGYNSLGEPGVVRCDLLQVRHLAAPVVVAVGTRRGGGAFLRRP